MIPKFRAWHKEMQVWCEPKEFNVQDLMTIGFDLSVHDDDVCMSVKYKDIELMQSTGLEDANGLEIFEGDILCYDHGGGVDTFMINRSVLDHQLISTYFYCENSWEPLSDSPCDCSIIIGNIYENPELSEETK